MSHLEQGLQEALGLTRQMIARIEEGAPWDRIEALESRRKQLLHRCSDYPAPGSQSSSLVAGLLEETRKQNRYLTGLLLRAREEVRSEFGDFNQIGRALKAYTSTP
ncbi:MAG: flagellar protein FliT [Gammaproteobacteria bacterium]|nr:flagellar protein FliT [Gammaproteobacteria bacterium]